jgi:cell division septation protein DedD
MITQYIKELLFEQDCVVIPEFGGFIADYVSAEIHPVRHTFSPPSKSIAFNEMLRLNDGLLASYVAQQEGITREEALNRIKDYTNQLWDELRQRNKYRLEEVGTLFLNQEQKLQFEPENRINYLNDSFGLPELLYKPVERSAAQRNAGAFSIRNVASVKTKDRPAMSNEEEYEEEPFSGRPANQVSRLWLFVAVPIVLLVVATAGLFLFFDDGNTVLSSFNPFPALYTQREKERAPIENLDSSGVAAEGNQESLPLAEEAAPVATTPEADNFNTASPEMTQPEEMKAETTPTVTNTAERTEAPRASVETKASASYIAIASEVPRYYVIVGSFTQNRNAMKLRKKLVAQGITESKLIVPKVETNLHKVSYADYATYQEASNQLDKIKSDYGTEVWVFKYVK